MNDWLTKWWCIQSMEHRVGIEKSAIDLCVLTSNNINVIMSREEASCTQYKTYTHFCFLK